jgi:hypothetical protein
MLKTHFVYSDLHAPYHDERAFQLTLNVLEKLPNLSSVTILGDWVDFHVISTHKKTRQCQLTLAQEVESARICRSAVDKRIRDKERAQGNKITKLYKLGNHEHRWEARVQESKKFLQETAAFFGKKEPITVDEALGFSCNGWKVRDYHDDPFKVGKFYIDHDSGRAGPDAAQRALHDVGRNFIFGHTHRLGMAYTGHLHTADRHAALNIGWLGDVRYIGYQHRWRAKRDWQLGFGLIVEAQKTKMCYAQAVPILPDYSCLVLDQRIALR